MNLFFKHLSRELDFSMRYIKKCTTCQQTDYYSNLSEICPFFKDVDKSHCGDSCHADELNLGSIFTQGKLIIYTSKSD